MLSSLARTIILIVVYIQLPAQLFTAVLARAVIKRDDSRFKSVVVFGDSLTDSRSFDYLYNNISASVDPKSLHPYTADYILRNSDGPIWVEYLASLLNDADLYNFARVGSTCDNSLLFRTQPDFFGQVYRYMLTETSVEAKENKLYLIWLGGNDITELFIQHGNSSAERERIMDAIHYGFKYNLERLYMTGARYILCLGVNPTDIYPKYYNNTQEFKQTYKETIMEYNKRLTANIVDLNNKHSDSKAVFFETYDLFHTFYSEEIIEENSAWHCNYSYICDGLYWDKAHYSTKVHAQFAQAIYNDLYTRRWL